MKLSKIRATGILIALSVFASGARSADVDALIRDTQRLVIEDEQIAMVWWIPWEFWQGILTGNPEMSAEESEQLLGVMDDYAILALLHGKTSAEGLQSVEPRAELLANTRMVANGNVLQPLEREEIKIGALTLLSQLRPLMVQAAGEVGEGLEFVVYPALKDDMPLIDATQSGLVDVTFFAKKYLWRLPLGSLMPPRVDSATGESFPGNYLYNPFTGEKL